MGNDSDDAVLLRATATPGAEFPTDTAERLGDNRTYSLLSYALTMAASLRFADAAEIGPYMAELNPRFSDVPQYRPEVAEALLRAVLGDAEQLEAVNPEDALALLFRLSQVLLGDLRLTEPEINEVIESVLTFADSIDETE